MRQKLSWVWIVLCGLVSLASLAINAHAPMYFDSDAASELILAKTLLESHHLIATPAFIYSTELQFFSSQLFMEAGLLVCGGNWLVARIVGTALLMVALVASYRYMAKQIGIWERGSWVAGVLLLPFGDYYVRFFLFGTYYVPELCAEFLAIGACLHAMKQGKASKLLLVLTGVLGFGFGANGYRTTLLCCIPAVLAICLCKFGESSGKTVGERLRNAVANARAELVCPAVLGASSVLGTLFNMAVFSKLFEYLRYGSLELIPFNFSDFLNLLVNGFVESWGYMGAPDIAQLEGIGALCSLVLTCTVFAATCICIARRRMLDARQWCVLVYLWLVLGLSTCMYYLGDRGTTRYLTLAVVPFIVAVPMAQRTFEGDVWLRRCTSGLVVILMVVQSCGVWFGPALGHATSNKPYPKEQLVEWLGEHGYTQGYATYWNANDIVEISNGSIDVWALQSSSYSGDEPSWEWLEVPSNYRWLEETRHAQEKPQGKVFLVLRAFELEQLHELSRVTGEPLVTFAGEKTIRLSGNNYGAEDYAVYEFESADALLAALSPA
ncbi:MAG: hypothetical protein IKG21_05400 [Atopobiaceae bacterium]|nr:hypothetical protein [Atopobiaceae bacterium]